MKVTMKQYKAVREKLEAVRTEEFMKNTLVRLAQGKDFDGYDERGNNKSRLCNVESESMEKVKCNQLIEIDFDGDGETIWHGIVTSKNKNNHTVNIYLP